MVKTNSGHKANNSHHMIDTHQDRYKPNKHHKITRRGPQNYVQPLGKPNHLSKNIHSDFIERNSSDTVDVNIAKYKCTTTFNHNPQPSSCHASVYSKLIPSSHMNKISRIPEKKSLFVVMKPEDKKAQTNLVPNAKDCTQKVSSMLPTQVKLDNPNFDGSMLSKDQKKVNFWISSCNSESYQSATYDFPLKQDFEKLAFDVQNETKDDKQNVSNYQQRHLQKQPQQNLLKQEQQNLQKNDLQNLSNIEQQNHPHYDKQKCQYKAINDDIETPSVESATDEMDDENDPFSTQMRRNMRRGPQGPRRAVYLTKEMGYYRQCFQPRQRIIY